MKSITPHLIRCQAGHTCFAFLKPRDGASNDTAKLKPRPKAIGQLLSSTAAPPRAGPAFSLLDLLVVIGLLTLLASLVIAVLSPQRNARTRQAVCVNNLHQLGAGLNSYVASLHQYTTADERGQPAMTGSGGRL